MIPGSCAGPWGRTAEQEHRIGEIEDRSEARRMWKKAARLAAVGLEMGLAVFIGYLGGAWVDTKLGTEPTFGLIGLLLGVAAAGKALWDIAKKAMKESEGEEEDRET